MGLRARRSARFGRSGRGRCLGAQRNGGRRREGEVRTDRTYPSHHEAGRSRGDAGKKGAFPTTEGRQAAGSLFCRAFALATAMPVIRPSGDSGKAELLGLVSTGSAGQGTVSAEAGGKCRQTGWARFFPGSTLNTTFSWMQYRQKRRWEVLTSARGCQRRGSLTPWSDGPGLLPPARAGMRRGPARTVLVRAGPTGGSAWPFHRKEKAQPSAGRSNVRRARLSARRCSGDFVLALHPACLQQVAQVAARLQRALLVIHRARRTRGPVQGGGSERAAQTGNRLAWRVPGSCETGVARGSRRSPPQ
jgi:hypothetical protein